MADAAPTSAQLKAADHASEESAEAVQRWEKLKAASLPELNHKLEAAHLPAINLEQKPQNMPDSGDQD